MRKIRILGTGVPTMDIYPAHKEMFPGGNEYNIACNVALLGEEAGFLGVFARDLAAGYLQDTLKNLGVDMCGIEGRWRPHFFDVESRRSSR